MKQFVIDQMKEYQCRKKIVKAIKYQEGMEDGWIIMFPDISEMDGYVDKVFNTKEDAKNYTMCPLFIREYGKEENYNIIPVMLMILADDEVEYFSNVIGGDRGFKYEFTEIYEDSWIVLDDENVVDVVYDTETFNTMYELPLSYDFGDMIAKIGYDEDLHEFFVKFNERMIIIDEKNGIETVEKILDGLQIPFTERIGTYFAD